MALCNLVSTFIVTGISVITAPIFTRLLDTSAFGLVSIFGAWAQVLGVFVGFEGRGSIGPAKANLPEEEQRPYQASVALLTLCNSMLFFVIFLLWRENIAELSKLPSYLAPLLVVQCFGSAMISLLNSIYTFNKMAQANLLISVSVSIASVILSLALILPTDNQAFRATGRILGFLIPPLLIGVVACIVFLLKEVRRIKLKYWKFCLVLTVPLMLHGLAGTAMAQIGRISIQQNFDDSLAGIYSIGITVASFVSMIQSATNSAFMPFMFDDLAGKNPEGIKVQRFRNYVVFFMLGTAAFLFVTPELLKVFAPESYWGVIPIIPILIVGHYCSFLYTFPVNYEFFVMKTAFIGIGTTAAAIISVLSAIVLVPQLGMLGAALSTTIAYFFLFIFHFLLARFRYGDRNYPARWFALSLTLVTGIALLETLLLDFVLLRWIFGLAFLAALAARLWKTKRIF